MDILRCVVIPICVVNRVLIFTRKQVLIVCVGVRVCLYPPCMRLCVCVCVRLHRTFGSIQNPSLGDMSMPDKDPFSIASDARTHTLHPH